MHSSYYEFLSRLPSRYSSFRVVIYPSFEPIEIIEINCSRFDGMSLFYGKSSTEHKWSANHGLFSLDMPQQELSRLVELLTRITIPFEISLTGDAHDKMVIADGTRIFLSVTGYNGSDATISWHRDHHRPEWNKPAEIVEEIRDTLNRVYSDCIPSTIIERLIHRFRSTKTEFEVVEVTGAEQNPQNIKFESDTILIRSRFAMRPRLTEAFQRHAEAILAVPFKSTIDQTVVRSLLGNKIHALPEKDISQAARIPAYLLPPMELEFQDRRILIERSILTYKRVAFYAGDPNKVVVVKTSDFKEQFKPEPQRLVTDDLPNT